MIVEYVIGSSDEPSFGKWNDVHTLVCVGGRERTRAEFTELLAETGFRLERVLPTAAGPSIVEAVPA
jgi:hypothetical protein